MAKKSKKASTKLSKSKKFQKVMHEWGQGTLKSSTGAKVTSQKQALRIAFEEARAAKKS